MAREQIQLLSFNRGLVSRLALARLDIKRLALSAETMVNWMPRVLGSMMLRPGLEHIGSTASNAAARFLPFIFATDDTALIELTNGAMRIWVNDALVTRPAVSSTVANGNFTSNLTSWTDNDESGGVSAWVTGGYMGLSGDGTAAAIRDQTVSASPTGTEHALRIVVQRGPVVLRVGTGTTDDAYINETELNTGTHSLVFTPSGNFNIRFLSRLKRQVLVDSCNVESAGVMSVTAPWLAADLGKIRIDQSADVVFIACPGYKQRRIERRATRSWSVADYEALDGPFRNINVGPITMSPGALSGNTTLTASTPYFRSTNVGSLFRVGSVGQLVATNISAQNTFTNAITVQGAGADQRTFTIVVDEDSGGSATFTLQRSLTDSVGPWIDVTSYTADTQVTMYDALDNQIAYYRLGVKTGDYGSGTHSVYLSYAVGSIIGVGRVTAVTSSTVVDIEVITDFGSTEASDDWAEGEWSPRRGFPSAVAFYEGRLWWAGKQGIWASISDAFDSFDEEFEGDAGPINRDVGSGAVDVINWLLAVSRLIAGAQGAEHSCRSSSLDEPLTPTNFGIKPDSTQGSAAVSVARIDKSGIFVQRGGTRIFELSRGPDGVDYDATDLTILVPEVGQPGVVRMAVQRQPDTRIHCVRSDGVAGVAVFDRAEKVVCWLEIETRDGDLIEDVVVLPGADGDEEDMVYYVVQRSINGSAVRYLEKWAMESECRGDSANLQADAFTVVTNSPAATTVTGLSHLEGETVVVWADGVDVGTDENREQLYTVSGGSLITTGLSYLELPGSQGNYASTPDSAALDITGDIDLRARVMLNDWTPNARNEIIGKWDLVGGAQSSYRFGIESTGEINLTTSPAGGSGIESVSTAVVPVADGESIWVRATLDVDNGAGSSVATFYTSTDGVSWTQLGAPVSHGGTSAIFASSTALFIGSLDATNFPLSGRVMEVEIRNGIGGSLVASFDAHDGVTGATSFVSSDTGETYTISQSGSPQAELVSQAALATAASTVVVGLPYTAQWRSTKLGTALNAKKNIPQLGVLLADTHYQGLQYGPDFDTLDDLPLVEQGAAIAAGTIHTAYEEEPFEFPGDWKSDSRLCLQAQAPRPCTILAATMPLEVNPKS